LDQQIGLPRNEVAQLRASFTDRWSRAPANEKPAYQAAVAVCIALSQSMDEREKAISNAQSSSAVHGSFDLHEHRKDRPSWKDLVREKRDEQNRKEETARQDQFLNGQISTNWQQRAIQLRHNIERLYAHERELERQAQLQAPAPRETIALSKSLQVKVKYGIATIPAGTTLPVISRDANGIVVEYSGEKVTLPP
jgi:hypothetical protein